MMKKTDRDIEPTPEDYERVQYQIDHAHEYMMDILARHEARDRVERERLAQRRALLHRLIPFLR
jgi:hypothetical protein